MEIKDLDKIKAVISEQFDNYLIIVSKDGETASTYSARCAAYGMCKMVAQDIELEWQFDKENEYNQVEEDEDES